MNKFLQSTALILALIVLVQGFQLPKNLKNEPCWKKSTGPRSSLIKQQIPQIPKADLPENWLWNDIDGVNYLTVARNQHIPEYCGGCWAFAATSAISDRIKIMRKAAWPDINISPQVLLSCSKKNGGCHGGDMIPSYEYMNRFNITDETCSIYQAKGYDNGLACTGEMICKNCAPGVGCWAQEDYPMYTVTEYGECSGEEKMMNEIKARGPITCAIAVTDELLNYHGGIFEDKSGDLEQTHAISIVGWGTQDGTPYWFVRNSWGETWGEQGFFQIVRGKNNLGIEDACDFGVPKDTWTEHKAQKEELVQKQQEEIKDQFVESYLDQPIEHGCFNNDGIEEIEEHVTEPTPAEYIRDEDLPEQWDWRNIDGVNYMSWSVNQHIPLYCGSCWAQAAASVMADRVNIMRKNAWPQAAYAVQAILNCGSAIGGSCQGGNPLFVYNAYKKNKLPTVTCQQYLSKNPEKFECSEIQKCMDCTPPPFPDSFCYPLKEYPSVKISQFGSLPINGIDAIKKEIYARGPVSCSIMATKKFEEEYNGGIFSQHLDFVLANHAISVVGWGVENGVEYWVGRNSWGTYWGEQGFFRIQMHGDNLGINRQCTWGQPTLE